MNGPVSDRQAIRAVRRALTDTRPNLVIAGPVSSCAYWAAAAGARPLAALSWGSDLLPEGGFTGAEREASTYALERSALVVVDTRAGEVAAKSLANVPSARIFRLPWGIDLGLYGRARPRRLRQRLGWRAKFVVVSARWWECQYDIDIVVEGFRLFHSQVPQSRLLLVGTGSQAGAVRSQVARAGLEGVVHMPGTLRGRVLRDALGSADAYASASRSDGTSVTLLESMAIGLLPVVSDTVGNAEWVLNGVNGFTFAIGSPTELCAGLLAARSLNGQARAGMVATNRRLVQSLANWRRNSRALLEACVQVARKAGTL